MDKKTIIAIDASRSIDSIQKTGVENVSDEILKNFLDLKKENVDFIFYTPELINWLPKENQKVLNWSFKFLWTQIRLSWEMLINKPDIFFSPVHILPFFTSKNTFRLIHDIAFKKDPKIYSFKQRILLNFDLYRAVKKCKKIFVPSNQVKEDLLNYTEIQENRIKVIPHGYTRQNKETGNKERKKQILFIGRIEEKKNILNLIKAFNVFSQRHPEYILILAGKIDQEYVDKNIDLFNTDKIQLLGYVSEEKKYQLLSESACLAYVSKEEGFGIPILEAFDFNLPVVCSDIPVLREVGGEVCVFVNQDSIEEISNGLEKITSDSLGNIKSQQQLEKFSWRISSEIYLKEIF
jgi:glycosyltransferase involved in cell wall biosynthesis